MRVIESPIDGEVVSADTDDELVRALRRHIEAQHFVSYVHLPARSHRFAQVTGDKLVQHDAHRI